MSVTSTMISVLKKDNTALILKGHTSAFVILDMNDVIMI